MEVEDPYSAGLGGGEGMVWCVCGEAILSLVGDGFVVTRNYERRWMRRRGDLFNCHCCQRRHCMSDLKELILAGPAPGTS